VTIGDQLHALNALARRLGLFTDKVHVTGGMTLEQLVTESWRRDDEPEPLPGGGRVRQPPPRASLGSQQLRCMAP
jgi:hypothetical protein